MLFKIVLLCTGLFLGGCVVQPTSLRVPQPYPVPEELKKLESLGPAELKIVSFENGLSPEEQILVLPVFILQSGDYCNARYLPSGGPIITAESIDDQLGNWEAEAPGILTRGLRDMGYTILEHAATDRPLQQKSEGVRYTLSARLVDMKADICNIYEESTVQPTGEGLGQVFIKIDWIIRDAANDDVLIENFSYGFHEHLTPIEGALRSIFDKAVADAANRIGLNDILRIISLTEPCAEDPTCT